MITSMHIQNFKCFKDFNIDLDPFTVLIGPNDSGKTAFLQAIRLVSALKPSHVHLPAQLGLLGITQVREAFWRNDTAQGIRIEVNACVQESEGEALCVVAESVPENSELLRFQSKASEAASAAWKQKVALQGVWGGCLRSAFAEAIGDVAYCRFWAPALNCATGPKVKLEPDGTGFPTFLADMILANRDAFTQLEQAFYARFPEYKHLAIDSPEGEYRLKFTTSNGQELPATAVSDGAMLSLAFLAMLHLPNPPTVLLIEEPENGVHHARLKEIVETLRQVNRDKGVQIIMTTHSPYLLDLVEPEEVRVFAKDEEGAVHQERLSDHPEVQSLKKHFMTGEIWTELGESKVVGQGGANR